MCAHIDGEARRIREWDRTVPRQSAMAALRFIVSYCTESLGHLCLHRRDQGLRREIDAMFPFSLSLLCFIDERFSFQIFLSPSSSLFSLLFFRRLSFLFFSVLSLSTVL